MPASQQETFLVVQFSEQSDYVNSFIFQGTYEQLYKLDHTTWSLNFFLLAPDPTQSPGAWGQPLMQVGSARSIHLAHESIMRALYHLRRCTPEQRAREVKLILERLEHETKPLTEKSYANTAEGNLARLKEAGIEPLTDEEIAKLRR